jgi:hypothetical protein
MQLIAMLTSLQRQKPIGVFGTLQVPRTFPVGGLGTYWYLRYV